jgi:hypothetical protein
MEMYVILTLLLIVEGATEKVLQFKHGTDDNVQQELFFLS